MSDQHPKTVDEFLAGLSPTVLATIEQSVAQFPRDPSPELGARLGALIYGLAESQGLRDEKP